MKNFLIPAFLFFFAVLPFYAQTEMDAKTSAAAYGQEYKPVPENQTVQTPELIEGIWQSSDRYVFFVHGKEISEGSDKAVLSDPLNPTEEEKKSAVVKQTPCDIDVILKTYYGWFYDRAAEPVSVSDENRRFVCTATASEAEHVTVTYEPLLERIPEYDANGNVIPFESGAWELVIQYGDKKRNVTRIPVAVIGNNLYLDFMIKGRTSDAPVPEENSKIFGFWQGVSRQNSIRVCLQRLNENITSYYIIDGAVYELRYWVTTMPYVEDYATFNDGDETFHVAKHIISDGNVFTCVTGRRTQIRNIEKINSEPEGYTLDSTGTILAFGKPYMTKVTGQNSLGKLMQIIAEANSRRVPDPKPLFPPEDLNWHWDLINLLEKDNAQVQAVRKRQLEFAETHGNEARKAAKQAASYSSRLKLETAAQ